MQRVVEKRVGLRKARVGEYQAVLSPYARCPDPLSEIPEDVATLDKKVLEPLQEAGSCFLKAHSAELGKSNDVPEEAEAADDQQDNKSKSELVVSPDNGAKCSVSVSRNEPIAFSDTPKDVRAWVRLDQMMRNDFQAPFFKLLDKYTGPTVTNAEVKVVIGWIAQIRDFRDLVAKQEGAKKEVMSLNPVPPFKVSPYVGKTIARFLEADRDSDLEGKAGQVIQQGGVIASKFPTFAPCELRNIIGHEIVPDRTEWCFRDPKATAAEQAELDLLWTMYPVDGATHGARVNALRKSVIHSNLTQLAIINRMLGKDAVPLTNACLVAPDSVEKGEYLGELVPYENYYNELVAPNERLWWASQLGRAVGDLERDWRLGKGTPPAPRLPEFYTTGENIALAWIQSFFQTHTFVARPKSESQEAFAGMNLADFDKGDSEKNDDSKKDESKKEADKDTEKAAEGAATPTQLEAQKKKLAADAKKAAAAAHAAPQKGGDTEHPMAEGPPDSVFTRRRIELAIADLHFSERFREGNRGAKGVSDYVGVLTEKLQVWAVLEIDNFMKLPPEQRTTGLIKMVKPAIRNALAESLYDYVTAITSEDFFTKQDSEDFEKAWKARFEKEWRAFLASKAFEPELDKMAESIVESLAHSPALREIYNPDLLADQALTDYVRSSVPRSRAAMAAKVTSEHLTNLQEWKDSPLWNLIPGPWNYHWHEAGWPVLNLQAPGFVSMKNFSTATPRYMQLEDGGDGIDRMRRLLVPDANYPDQFLFIKDALKRVAERQEDKLVERLITLGYTDKSVREQFGIENVFSVRELAQRVIRRFKALVDADEAGDPVRAAQTRASSMAWIIKWLNNDDNRLVYDDQALKFAINDIYTVSA